MGFVVSLGVNQTVQDTPGLCLTGHSVFRVIIEHPVALCTLLEANK